MSVNGVTSAATADSYKTTTAAKSNTKAAEEAAKKTESGVVYEKSSSTTQKYKPNAELVAKLKADADAQAANLQKIVQDLISKQGNSYGQANDIWSFLSNGNFTVDAATKAQAQTDTAVDGYWGAGKTSDRIVDFAKALTGGNPDQIEKMRSAFEKGFKQATGTWGKDLPSLSQDTYKSTMDKFDQWAKEANTSSDSTI